MGLVLGVFGKIFEFYQMRCPPMKHEYLLRMGAHIADLDGY